MCKLCNTDTPPVNSFKTKNKEMMNYLNIHKQYMYNEMPCDKCIKGARTAISNNLRRSDFLNLNWDHYILKKLYLTNRNFKAKELRNLKIEGRTIRKTVLGIRIKTNTNTNYTSYEARVTVKSKKKTIGVYSTFEQAINEKIAYLKATGHKNALTQLKNNLKEIKNGKS